MISGQTTGVCCACVNLLRAGAVKVYCAEKQSPALPSNGALSPFSCSRSSAAASAAMLTAPVFYPPFGNTRMNEKTRLTAHGKSRRSGYGSALSTETCLPSSLPKPYYEPPSADMADDTIDVEMRGPGEHSSLGYRRITSHSVSLPKEVWYRRIRVPGFLNRTSPHSNAVHTTKYTVLNFIPKNLWEQFHRLANIFFLFIALLNFVPEVVAFGKEIGYIPLLFVLSCTALKDIFEDWRRYRSDREVNAKLCRVYDR